MSIKLLKYNPGRISNVLTVFDDMIADMISNKKTGPRVAELFIRARKLNISTTFNAQSYCNVTNNVQVNRTHFFVMKIPKK